MPCQGRGSSTGCVLLFHDLLVGYAVPITDTETLFPVSMAVRGRRRGLGWSAKSEMNNEKTQSRLFD